MTMTAADIRNFSAGAEFFLDAAERRRWHLLRIDANGNVFLADNSANAESSAAASSLITVVSIIYSWSRSC